MLTFEKIYIHMRKNQQKTTNKLCTKGRVKKKQ